MGSPRSAAVRSRSRPDGQVGPRVDRKRKSFAHKVLRVVLLPVWIAFAGGCGTLVSSLSGRPREARSAARGLLRKPGESAGMSALKTRPSGMTARPMGADIARSSTAPARQVEALVKARPVSNRGGEDVPAGPALPPLGNARVGELRLPDLPEDGEGIYPIDLPAALKLAGASEAQTQAAAERVKEADAALARARLSWLPSLQIGAGYARHQGLVQQPDGTLSDVRTDNSFFGGGAALDGGAGLTAASNGPARLQAGVSVTDAIFAPLAAKQRVSAAQARKTATFHLGLLQAAGAYLDLLRAQAEAVVVLEATAEAEELLAVVKRMQGLGVVPLRERLETEAYVLEWRQRQTLVETRRLEASAELGRVLQLDPTTRLAATDTGLVPFYLADPDRPLDELVKKGLRARPELAAAGAEQEVAQALSDAEAWRPWLPKLYVGYGTGMQSAGASEMPGERDQREDFDALAVWEIRHLGLGTRAVQREAQSRSKAATFVVKDVKATVGAEIAKAHAAARQTRLRRIQAEPRSDLLTEAWLAERPLLPDGRTTPDSARRTHRICRLAQLEYVDCLTAENHAQFRLLWALGSPPAMPVGGKSDGSGKSAADEPVAREARVDDADSD